MESEVNDVARYGEDCDVWWVKTLGLISRFKVRRRDHNSRNMIHNTMVYGERKTPNRYPSPFICILVLIHVKRRSPHCDNNESQNDSTITFLPLSCNNKTVVKCIKTVALSLSYGFSDALQVAIVFVNRPFFLFFYLRPQCKYNRGDK